MPGNHDVGDEPPGQDPDQIVDADRLARWDSYFATDRWALDAGGWRLLGVNAQPFGSSLAREHAQIQWLDEHVNTAGRPIALFLHKPLFLLLHLSRGWCHPKRAAESGNTQLSFMFAEIDRRTAEAKRASVKAVSCAPAAFDMCLRKRAPWFRPEDHWSRVCARLARSFACKSLAVRIGQRRRTSTQPRAFHAMGQNQKSRSAKGTFGLSPTGDRGPL